jgi:hypothetical protein
MTISTSPTDTIEPQRPTPLPGPLGNGPSGLPFHWGPIVTTHRIGDIEIVEYLRDQSTFSQPEAWSEHGLTAYMGYAAGSRIGTMHTNLDSAVVDAITYKRRGPNCQAAEMFDLMTLGTIVSETSIEKR